MSFELQAKLALLEAEHRALKDFTVEMLTLLGFTNPMGVGLVRSALKPLAQKHIPAPGVDDAYALAFAKLVQELESRVTPVD
ncbi:hypothetical protein D3C73_422560 [compost metagenome]